MKKARYWIVLMVAVLALAKLHSLAFAQDTELSRQTLRGLQGVQVLVEDLKPEIERGGLTKQQLQRDTELRLRMAGIKVLSEIESFNTPGAPYLHVYANVVKGKHRPTYIYSITVGLIQKVSLVRAPGIVVEVITWAVGRTGFTPELRYIRARIKDLVDQFINAYLSVNPK